MEDWEDVQVEPLSVKDQLKGVWDDEDADENDVKESWEDEPEPAPAPKPTAEKAPKKPAAKATEKKAKTVEAANEVLLDPVAEKLRQQRLVEESDFRATIELFSNKGDERTLDDFIPSKKGDERTLNGVIPSKKGGERTLNDFVPKSKSDFTEYAELISHKLRPYEKSFHYIGLLKAVMRLSMTAMKGADAKEFSSSVTAIANEKIKLEKEANASKKKGGPKKKQLQVGAPGDEMAVGGQYAALDDYDFM